MLSRCLNKVRALASLRVLLLCALRSPRSLLKLHLQLIEIGWVRSCIQKMPYAQDGSPIPWWSYSAIYFLENRLSPTMRVFEYGSGNSTLWFAQRVESVAAVEHSRGWHDRLLPSLPKNARLLLQPLAETKDYENSILRVGGLFDVVVIDGRRRNECAESVLQALAPHGVLVWDNSERERYRTGHDSLIYQGFRTLEFSGMGPSHSACFTTIYYRDGNCLGI